MIILHTRIFKLYCTKKIPFIGASTGVREEINENTVTTTQEKKHAIINLDSPKLYINFIK